MPASIARLALADQPRALVADLASSLYNLTCPRLSTARSARQYQTENLVTGVALDARVFHVAAAHPRPTNPCTSSSDAHPKGAATSLASPTGPAHAIRSNRRTSISDAAPVKSP
jgi:hypothetical protein